ncbi:hypothetical protein CKAN_02650800 [Cinnamomum micranthum f. kanehirae]|uniref:Uncharacterized protein n=1 Tax=Cinnamomum micranthum f. kanehirae TaxID=337451 RepID=A0A443Q246_9MAGN|nr:hypothetical protein CKAN_02650800 [Cinnamomum micranthum f. kanehirae]
MTLHPRTQTPSISLTPEPRRSTITSSPSRSWHSLSPSRNPCADPSQRQPPLQSLCSSSLSRPRTVAPSSSTRRPHHHHQQRRAPSSLPLLPPRAELIPFTEDLSWGGVFSDRHRRRRSRSQSSEQRAALRFQIWSTSEKKKEF